jgi:glycine/D-amino acid oxidase-like deaminating enzyme
MLPEIPRRSFLRGALATGALVAATRANAFALVSPQRRLAPVKVSRDRIIREVVGLRPYRDEGFVVAAERLGDKLFVHNYGHGGAGITLSWGTASLAVDLLSVPGAVATGSSRQRERAAPRFAVLGAGVNGLSTARVLQRRYGNAGATVTIYAKALPPDTTSNIAGGFWSPTGLFDPSVATATFNEQFSAAAKISNRAFQLLVGPEYGVRWIDTFRLYRTESLLDEELEGGNDLYPAQQIHRNPDQYFGFPFVRQYSTMLIEPQTYLRALLRDFYIAGGKLIVKEFRDRRELMRLPERVVFNCTGLGARALFNDQKLGPVRGQLAILLPQPEIDYCYLGPGHMFPRHDGIVLGGTFDHDDWSLLPRADQRDDIIAKHTKIMKGLK